MDVPIQRVSPAGGGAGHHVHVRIRHKRCHLQQDVRGQAGPTHVCAPTLAPSGPPHFTPRCAGRPCCKGNLQSTMILKIGHTPRNEAYFFRLPITPPMAASTPSRAVSCLGLGAYIGLLSSATCHGCNDTRSGQSSTVSIDQLRRFKRWGAAAQDGQATLFVATNEPSTRPYRSHFKRR